jgi:O-antigen ligase
MMSIVRKSKVIIGALLILLILSPFIAPQKIKDWAKSVNYNPVVFLLNADRISIYRNSVNMIKQHPVIGVGVNTFCRNYLTYKLPEPEGAKSADHVYSHNNFLQMAGELGLFGLVAFLWFLFRLFKQAAKSYRGLDDRFLKIMCLAAIASVLSFLINGLTETSLYYSRVAMVFWFLTGLSLSFAKFTNAAKNQ